MNEIQVTGDDFETALQVCECCKKWIILHCDTNYGSISLTHFESYEEAFKDMEYSLTNGLWIYKDYEPVEYNEETGELMEVDN